MHRSSVRHPNEAKYGFDRLIDVARTKSIAVINPRPLVVVLLSVEEYERLKSPEIQLFQGRNGEAAVSSTESGAR